MLVSWLFLACSLVTDGLQLVSDDLCFLSFPLSWFVSEVTFALMSAVRPFSVFAFSRGNLFCSSYGFGSNPFSFKFNI